MKRLHLMGVVLLALATMIIPFERGRRSGLQELVSGQRDPRFDIQLSENGKSGHDNRKRKLQQRR